MADQASAASVAKDPKRDAGRPKAHISKALQAQRDAGRIKSMSNEELVAHRERVAAELSLRYEIAQKAADALRQSISGIDDDLAENGGGASSEKRINWHAVGNAIVARALAKGPPKTLSDIMLIAGPENENAVYVSLKRLVKANAINKQNDRYSRGAQFLKAGEATGDAVAPSSAGETGKRRPGISAFLRERYKVGQQFQAVDATTAVAEAFGMDRPTATSRTNSGLYQMVQAGKDFKRVGKKHSGRYERIK